MMLWSKNINQTMIKGGGKMSKKYFQELKMLKVKAVRERNQSIKSWQEWVKFKSSNNLY